MLPADGPPENLTQAISWSGSAREMATMGGPALAGALIAAFGSEAVYIGQADLLRAFRHLLCDDASAGPGRA